MKPFLITIVVDAQRNYYTTQDERGLQPIYSKLPSYNFSNSGGCVVSAPSSVMSAITMLTGKPAYSQFQDYVSVDLSKLEAIPYTDYARKYGFQNIGLFCSREMRNVLSPLYENCPNNLLLNKNAYAQERWTNKFISDQTLHLIESDIFNKSTNLMLWYNSRDDWDTSYHIQRVLDKLASLSVYENSTILFTGDHGYPDQKRGLTSDGPDLKKAGKPHDLIMTDDNIIVPFSVKFPSSSTLRLRNVLYNQSVFSTCARSALQTNLPIKLSRDELTDSNYFIGDSRFIGQPDRQLTIRSLRKKVVFNPDSNQASCYDLVNDPEEVSPKIYPFDDIPDFYNDIYSKFLTSEQAVFKSWIANYRSKYNSFVQQGPVGFFVDKLLAFSRIRVSGSQNFKLLVTKSLEKENFQSIIPYSIVFVDDYRRYRSIKKFIRLSNIFTIFILPGFVVCFGLIHLYTIHLVARVVSTYRRFLWRSVTYSSSRDVLFDFLRTFLPFKK